MRKRPRPEIQKRNAEIIDEYINTDISQAELAEKYHLSQASISTIVSPTRKQILAKERE